MLTQPTAAFQRLSLTQLGCNLDVNLDTKLNSSGSAPAFSIGAANSAVINAFLATCSLENPIELFLDGPCPVVKILLPAVPYIKLTGMGRYTGFIAVNGANSSVLANKAGAPFERQTAAPTPAGYVICENFRIVGNRAGNSTTGNARGSFVGGSTSNWFNAGTNLYCNVDFENLASFAFRGVESFDPPLYCARITNCWNGVLDGCVFDSSSNYADGNGDGLHISGPCGNIAISKCKFNCPSDDCLPLNLPEGYGGTISNITVSDCQFYGTSFMRVYSGTFQATNIRSMNNSGTVSYGNYLILGIQPGTITGTGGLTTAVDQIRDISLNGCNLGLSNITGVHSVASAISLCNSIGSLKLIDHVWRDPLTAIPWFGLASTGISAGEVDLDLTVIRSPSGNAEGGVIFDSAYDIGYGTTNTCHFKKIRLRRFRISDQIGQSYGAIPWLFRFATGSVDVIQIDDVDSTNITALVEPTNGFTNIGAIQGTGVLATGWQIPDSVIANNTPYISATGANAGKACIKIAGIVTLL